MSRLTEALRRANEGAAAAPVDSHESIDTFPIEAEEAEPVRAAVPMDLPTRRSRRSPANTR